MHRDIRQVLIDYIGIADAFDSWDNRNGCIVSDRKRLAEHVLEQLCSCRNANGLLESNGSAIEGLRVLLHIAAGSGDTNINGWSWTWLIGAFLHDRFPEIPPPTNAKVSELIGDKYFEERGSAYRHMEKVSSVPKKQYVSSPGSKGSHQHVADRHSKVDPQSDIDTGHVVHPVDQFMNLFTNDFNAIANRLKCWCISEGSICWRSTVDWFQ